MRIVVTGASGFVGRWLVEELTSAGHEAIGTPPSSILDITDTAAVTAFVEAAEPDAVAHLAGMSFGPDARRQPERAIAVNEGGTRSVMAAIAATAPTTPLLVVSSSEVYGAPDAADLPIRESAPLRATHPYGLSKLAQERAALDAIDHGRPPIVVVRPFNHIGPGQRPDFVVPALAGRILAAQRAGNHVIKAGNVDVLRDFTDVRDVARAYRLILERLDAAAGPQDPRIYNIASGRSVSIRGIAEAFAAMVGLEIAIEVDPGLVRPGDPPEIRGDASALAKDVGWQPSIPLGTSLRDILGSIS